ncbi:class I SAM-dependent methyltransferase [Cupriavidus metallidurans]|nr:class I SAM-dependent methyltransferase [Cupriavidus metallidurans]
MVLVPSTEIAVPAAGPTVPIARKAMQSKDHWETVYATKPPTEVSWYQSAPTLSLDLIRKLDLPADAAIADIGGGASTLVDHLLSQGFHRLVVIDLAGHALAAARDRLGARAAGVRWIEGDVTTPVLPEASVDLWHDRAVFHFLTTSEDRGAYVAQARRAVRPGGHLIIATFALDGPMQCSGLPVARYDVAGLRAEFAPAFDLVAHTTETHTTPAGHKQSFLYCHFVPHPSVLMPD